LALEGVFAVPTGAGDPARVSRKTGTVVYPLLDPRSGARRGRMVVRLVADDRLRAEVFAGAGADGPAFSDKSGFYRRWPAGRLRRACGLGCSALTGGRARAQ